MSPYALATWAAITLVLALAVGTGSRGKHSEGMHLANYERVDTLWKPQGTPASEWLDSVAVADSLKREKK